MAKVRPGATLPGRGNSLRKAVYFRVHRGVLVAVKWPRPRGKPKTPEHKQQVEWFRQAQKVASRVDAKTQMTIRNAFARSPLMPRDVATSLMAGRMYQVHRDDGRTIRSRRAMQQVSKSLDIISSEPGHTLVRGAEVWEGTTPVETADRWIWPISELAWTGSASSADFAWKGNAIDPTTPIVMSRIGAILDLVAAANYRAALAVLDGSNLITSWTETVTASPSTSGRQMLSWPLAAVLSPGSRYVLAVGRLGVPADHELPIVGIPSASYSWPGPRTNFCGIESATPGIGTQAEVTTPGAHAVGVFASF